ncbi:MAG: DNA-directed RNA polymerase subunit delta [Schwartzia sp.]|nr:DNA-directed RNA polymerase subunit delta [Schwartzia sp. (in: firmicutes)]MBR1885785.1 DNA-directed RNA polymerase subunit delta [Schwartzia sp. (in: firmicutes)]
MKYEESSEMDIAYDILSKKGEPVYYKDLITEVIKKKAKPVQSLSRAIAEVYTQINMDSRFQHTGKSMWGLTEWNPPETKRGASSSSASSGSPKTSRLREKKLESIQEG